MLFSYYTAYRIWNIVIEDWFWYCIIPNQLYRLVSYQKSVSVSFFMLWYWQASFRLQLLPLPKIETFAHLFFQLYCTGFYSGRQWVIMWMALGVVTIRATPQKALQSLFNGVSMHFFSKVFFWGHADRFLLLFSKSQLFQIHLGIVHTKQSCTSALSSTILLSAYKVPRAILLGNLTKPELNPKPLRTNSPFHNVAAYAVLGENGHITDWPVLLNLSSSMSVDPRNTNISSLSPMEL